MIKYYNVFNKLAWIFVIYVIGDIITTYLALPYGHEGNPIIAAVLGAAGFAGLIVLKTMYVLMLYYVAESLISRGYARLWNVTANAVILIGIVIMINNLNIYLTGIGVI